MSASHPLRTFLADGHALARLNHGPLSPIAGISHLHHSRVMIRTTVHAASIVLALLWGGQTRAAAAKSHFAGNARQTATMSGALGHRSLSVVVGGDLSKGTGVQADCELRAVETGRSWHLVPFASDAMVISAADIRGVHFRLWPIGKRAFRIDTDYGNKNCAAGLSFNGTYRRR